MPVTEVTDFPQGNPPNVWQSPGGEKKRGGPRQRGNYFPLTRGESVTSVTRGKKACIFKGISGHKFMDHRVTGCDPKRDLTGSLNPTAGARA